MQKKKSMSSFDQPTVTIAIPTYNEEEHIGRVIFGFINQNYPNLEEILVCDGGSTDKTVGIVEGITQKYPQVKLMHNPQKHQTFALNLMIEKAKGEIFLRADSHSEYADDYIAQCVKSLKSSGALNAGGAQRYLAKTSFQAAVAFANKSYFGSGNALYKRPDFSGFVDTVYLGCFYTKVLKELDGFSTLNIQNQDTELNLRLADKQPNAIYLSADIQAWYYPRKNLLRLWSQYYRYGKGRRITHDQHPASNRLRGRLPFLLFLALIAVFVWSPIYFTGLLSGVFLLVLSDVSRSVINEYDSFIATQWRGDSNSQPKRLFLMFTGTISVGVMTLAHALGFMTQTIKRYLPFLK